MTSRLLLGALILCLFFGPSTVTVRGQATGASATGNLLQLMRGVFFPTSNMIFNVQSNDPNDKEKKKAERKPGSGGDVFDWNQWGGSLYSGWEDVEYAAVVLAEVTPLLLTPGRVCQNGKPVPVERADWINYTNALVRAARKSYEAARKRDQMAVADSTGELSEACQNCHAVYRRGAPGAEPGSQSALAQRCSAP